MEFPILYEDEDLIVIDKPAGVTVNRAETTKNEVTVQDWMEERLGFKNHTFEKKEQKEGEWDPEVEFYNRGGVVHRLDKETSGLLILAKNPTAFAALQAQFKERTVKKTYIALAHGKITPEEGEINVPVGRLPWNRKQFGIIPGGRESKTTYKVIGYYHNENTLGKSNYEAYSLLELYPHSGRTHQIRVHLKYIGHPIISDFLYAGRKTSRNDRKLLPRVFLHAAKLSFLQSSTGKQLAFESPLPSPLSDFLTTISKLS